MSRGTVLWRVERRESLDERRFRRGASNCGCPCAWNRSVTLRYDLDLAVSGTRRYHASSLGKISGSIVTLNIEQKGCILTSSIPYDLKGLYPESLNES